MMNIRNVTFVGLGVMGFPVAGHIANAGFNTKVYNRTESKAKRWVTQYPGIASSTPKESATDADVVAICVGNDEDVRSVVYGQAGVLEGMRAGSVLVDHTTTSAELAEELSLACKEKGIHFIDAPLSGGEAGAESGSLTITPCVRIVVTPKLS